jgi:hypothetical protein
MWERRRSIKTQAKREATKVAEDTCLARRGEVGVEALEGNQAPASSS